MNDLKVKEIVTQNYITPSKLPGYDYVINPYVGCAHACIYCYAEFMKRFSNHDEPWGTFTDVKVRSTCAKMTDLRHKQIFLSSVTDCYNPLEAKYRLTRRLLEHLQYSGAHITLLTKSDLVLKDLDLLTQIPDIRVGFSIQSLDEEFCKKTEPNAPSVSQRINALKTLHENNIKTWVHISPIFPQLSDWQAVVQATRAYADSFSFENLKLRAAPLARVLLYITRHHPHLKELYQQIYVAKEGTYWKNLRKEILKFCNEQQLRAEVHFSEDETPEK